MKFGEILPDLVGQDANVVIPRPFIELTGGLEAAAVLADLVWWQGNAGPDEWFWRTDATISERQGVSIYAVAKARDLFRASGWIETDRRGVPAKMYYRVDLDLLASGLVLRKRGTSPAIPENLSRGNAEPSIKGLTKVVNERSPDPNGSPGAGAVEAPPKTLSDDKLMFLELCSWLGTTPANCGPLRGKLNAWIAGWRKEGARPVHVIEARRLYGLTFKGGKGAVPSKQDMDVHIAQARAGRTVTEAHEATERRARDVDGPFAAWVEH